MGPVPLKGEIHDFDMNSFLNPNGFQALVVGEGTTLSQQIQSLLNSIWYEVLVPMTWDWFFVIIGPTTKSRLMKSRF